MPAATSDGRAGSGATVLSAGSGATAPSEGTFFDGVSGTRRRVGVVADATGLAVTDLGTGERWHHVWRAVAEVDAGNARARFHCGSDARLELADPALVGTLRSYLRPGRRAMRGRGAVISVGLLAALAGAVWLAIAGLPGLLAPHLPAHLTERMGLTIVRALAVNHGTCVEPEGREAMRRLLAQLVTGRTADTTGHLLDLPPVTILMMPQPNAMALPGGHLIVTRSLIARARSPAALAGVLAHELGHLEHRHAERGLVRSMGLSGLASLLAGGSNLGQMTAQMSTLAGVLAYSRAAEREADAFAVQRLQALGVPTAPLAGLLRAIATEGTDEFVPTLLSTHPATAERLEMLEAADLPDGESGPGTALLTDAEWRALRAVCTKTVQPSGRAG